jgi:hypothetical protein
MKKAHSLFIIVAIMFVFSLTLTAQNATSTERKATIAGISGGDISKDLLLKTTEFSCTDPKFKVVSFILSFSKRGDIIEYTGTGNNLSVVMINAIKGIDPGSKLIIEKISAKNESGETIDIPAMVLVLK